jgi:hypothetical protein
MCGCLRNFAGYCGRIVTRCGIETSGRRKTCSCERNCQTGSSLGAAEASDAGLGKNLGVSPFFSFIYFSFKGYGFCLRVFLCLDQKVGKFW